jgi:hypothetical protein
MALQDCPFYFPKVGLKLMLLCYIDGAASSPILLSKMLFANDACVESEWFLNKH